MNTFIKLFWTAIILAAMAAITLFSYTAGGLVLFATNDLQTEIYVGIFALVVLILLFAGFKTIFKMFKR